MTIRQTGSFEGRNIRIDSREFRLKPENFIGEGAAGEVYRISQNEAVKIYIKSEDAARLQNKILVLCGKTREHDFADSVVAPLAPAWMLENGGGERFCGFSMRLISEARNISDYSWKPGVWGAEEELFDRTIAGFLYDLCDGLRTLHHSRVVVADLKPDNILVADGRAWLIDFDSCDIAPDYPADNWTEDYLDPLLTAGVSQGGQAVEFTPASDWWALGVIAFQLFLGLLPWEGSNPRLFSSEERIANYSVVGFDPEVGVPEGWMRPMDWFVDKPRLLTYFERLFSPDPHARYSIDYTLESYIPKPEDVVRSTWQPGESYPALATNDFNREFVEAIRKRAGGGVYALERHRIAFLNHLLSASV